MLYFRYENARAEIKKLQEQRSQQQLEMERMRCELESSKSRSSAFTTSEARQKQEIERLFVENEKLKDKLERQSSELTRLQKVRL